MLAAATFLPFGGASAQSADAQQRIADQANRLLALLDDRQRRQVADRLRLGQSRRLALHPAQPLGPQPGRDEAAQADAARALFATVLNERGLKLLDGVRLRRRRVARTTRKLPRSRPLLPLGVRHARPLPLGLALRGPSPVAERGAAGGRSCRRDAVLRRRPSGRPCATGRTRVSRLLGTSEDLARQIMTGLTRSAAAHRADRRPLVRRDRGQPAARARSRPAARPGARRHGRPVAPARRGADGPLPRHAGARSRSPARSSA